jgi:sulfur-oxidizing protein SoxY
MSRPTPALSPRRRTVVTGLLATVAAGLVAGAAGTPAHAADDDVWPTLRSELFGARPILEESPLLAVTAPYRADDAALVPVTITLPAAAGEVVKLTVVVEKNPAPMAAAFTFGPAAGTGERTIATRLRFDMYSNLRVVAERADGSLHMVTRFVKAAGGCSAPALKDADEALAQLGRTVVRDVAAAPDATDGATSATRTGQVMVRHPNYSGMQMNQLTGYFIPAKYVTEMKVARGGVRVFDLEAGISLSEDPNIRFTYAGAPGEALTVTTTDSDGRVFSAAAGPIGGS